VVSGIGVFVVGPAARIRQVIAFHGQDGSLLLRDRAARVWLNAGTGEVLGVRHPAQMTALHRWIDTADPLHFGDFGGVWSKAIWLTFGLALSAMCLTGAYLQAKRQARGRGLSRRALHAAHLTTLVILLCASGWAVEEVGGYGDGAVPSAPLGVWLVIALFVCSTVAALAWWASAVSQLPAPQSERS
jgi:fatty acid desaturase